MTNYLLYLRSFKIYTLLSPKIIKLQLYRKIILNRFFITKIK